MRPIAVLDSTVVVAGIGWQGDSRQILALLARRGLVSVRTSWLMRVGQHGGARCPRGTQLAQPQSAGVAKLAQVIIGAVGPSAHAATIKRDPKDDPVIAAAVAAHAKYLVSYDRTYWIWTSLTVCNVFVRTPFLPHVVSYKDDCREHRKFSLHSA